MTLRLNIVNLFSLCVVERWDFAVRMNLIRLFPTCWGRGFYGNTNERGFDRYACKEFMLSEKSRGEQKGMFVRIVFVGLCTVETALLGCQRFEEWEFIQQESKAASNALSGALPIRTSTIPSTVTLIFYGYACRSISRRSLIRMHIADTSIVFFVQRLWTKLRSFVGFNLSHHLVRELSLSTHFVTMWVYNTSHARGFPLERIRHKWEDISRTSSVAYFIRA